MANFTLEEVHNFGSRWIQAWNNRDVRQLSGMFSQNNRFSQPVCFFEPKLLEGENLSGTRWLDQKLNEIIDVLNKNDIRFTEPHEIKLGHNAVMLRYKSNNNLEICDRLELNEQGRIYNASREIEK